MVGLLLTEGKESGSPVGDYALLDDGQNEPGSNG
jgi:hypothetical protein